MIDKIAGRVSKRYVLMSLTLLLALGLFMMGVYAPWFSARAGGQPYMETKLGYLPVIYLKWPKPMEPRDGRCISGLH